MKKKKTGNIGTLNVLINDYLGDDVSPSRTLKFEITKDCLEDYLRDLGGGLDAQTFLDTYGSDEAEGLYGYASDDNRILSERIDYCDAFRKDYADFVNGDYDFRGPGLDNGIATGSSEEDFYWAVYKKHTA